MAKIPFFSAFDIADEVFRRMCEAVKDAGGTGEDLREFTRDRKKLQQFGKLVVGVKPAAENIFRVTVDYSRSLAEMIKAGRYDLANQDITADHFPVTGEGKRELELVPVHLNRVVSTEEAIAEIKSRGLRPGKLEELLALGEKHPDLQREFPILALGSVWQSPYGRRFCPSLWSAGAWRILYPCWLVHDWGGRCRFLAVRESMPAGRQA